GFFISIANTCFGQRAGPAAAVVLVITQQCAVGDVFTDGAEGIVNCPPGIISIVILTGATIVMITAADVAISGLLVVGAFTVGLVDEFAFGIVIAILDGGAQPALVVIGGGAERAFAAYCAEFLAPQEGGAGIAL